MLKLPKNIADIIKNKKYDIDQIGQSDSTVFLFDDMVLKIQPDNEEADNECGIMQWLQDKLPVPEVLYYEKENSKSYLLMSKVKGKMSCDQEYMLHPDKLLSILTGGLQQLWQIDISNCPYVNNLDKKLRMAKYNVEHGLVDIDNTEPDTFGPGGFKNPNHLLEWLIENRPQEEMVLSHGDYCLPNVMADHGEVCGFIDLGRAGVADKWQDIALCYRSLQHNYGGKYTNLALDVSSVEMLSDGYKAYREFRAEKLFEVLGIEPDYEKLKYYILLDELF